MKGPDHPNLGYSMSQSQPEGFLAVPPAGQGPAVLVLHAWWGLNDTIRAICQRLADAGFVAFAPDLYHGQVADTIPEAQALANTLDDQQAQADVAASAEFLGQGSGADGGGLAVIGFSLGAYFALEFSAAAPELVRAVVVFYGTGPDEFSGAQAAYLGHFAEHDEFEPLDNVAELESILQRAGRPVTFYRYPGVGHWFFEPDRPDAYDAASAELAWERTLDFLQRNVTA